jgi:two-component system, chemotaxis family, response regulator Rcp1
MKTWHVLAGAHYVQNPEGATDWTAHPCEEKLLELALGNTAQSDRSKIESHLRECEDCHMTYQDAQVAADRVKEQLRSQGRLDQRASVRYEVRESAIVTQCYPLALEPAIGQVMDVSAAGLRIRLQMVIHRGTQVQVLVENAAVFGTVRYCRKVSESTYDVGLVIDQTIIRSGIAPASLATASKTRRFAKFSRKAATTVVDPIHILVVEDNPADVKLIQLMFEGVQVPHRVTVVSDGAQALERLFDLTISKPDIVLLDLNLPKLGGLEVLRRLRADRTTESVSVVVLSSSTADVDIRRTTGLGIRAYLPKPDSIHHYEEMRTTLSALVSEAVH